MMTLTSREDARGAEDVHFIAREGRGVDGVEEGDETGAVSRFEGFGARSESGAEYSLVVVPAR